MAKSLYPRWTKKEIRRLSRISPRDVQRALDLLAEPSPMPAGMAMAESEDSDEGNEAADRRDGPSPGVQRFSFRATFKGVFRVQGDPYLYFGYGHVSRQSGGATRHLTGGAPLRDPAMLERVEMELRRGDEVRITIETGWDAPGLPTTLIGFAKISGRAGAKRPQS